MRIKGSELRRIIKEEISRSALANRRPLREADDVDDFEFGPGTGIESIGQEGTTPISRSLIATVFVNRLEKFVAPNAPINQLKVGLTADPRAKIEFSGNGFMVRAFSPDSKRKLYSAGKGLLYSSPSEIPDFFPFFEFEEITINGEPMYPRIIDEFNKPNQDLLPSAVKNVRFSAEIELDELDKDFNLSADYKRELRDLIESYVRIY